MIYQILCCYLFIYFCVVHFTIPDNRRPLFPSSLRKYPRETHFHVEPRNRTHQFVLLSGRQQLLVSEQENDEEEEEDEEMSSYSDSEASSLSLSMKPDRNIALLDDYELEELDYSDPNHRSG